MKTQDTTLFDRIEEAKQYISTIFPSDARMALVLGTGLGEYANGLNDAISIPYIEIPHFPISTVEGHAGKLIYGFRQGIPIIVMAGRFHYYEGYSSQQVTFPIRVLKALGIDEIILTNAAGGLNPHYNDGEIVCVSDHINMMPDHPLRGYNDERLGLRFPDMLNAYDQGLRSEFHSLADKIGMRLKSGIYLGLQGPSLETPAEYKMARTLGADILGMSTIPEVIVANHAGMKVAVFSIVSNLCFPSSKLTVTTLEDVISVVNKTSVQLASLLDAFLEKRKSL
jgi:purine-nucleoside phosphorylase